jgi:hypothetical protein
MQRRDAVAVPWMAKFQRSPWPGRVVWVQDDVRHSRFYWLRTNAEQAKPGDEVTAEITDGAVQIRSSSADEVTLLLSDSLVSLDSAVSVIHPNGKRTEHRVERTAGVLAAALRERSDLPGIYSAVLKLQLQR